ncbi:MAG: ABC transporter permease, partial [bacterium]
MYKNYLKIAIRNLYKNKLYSIINIVGLGVTIAMCVVAFVNYQFSQSFDSYHENADKIYCLNSYKILNNARQNWSYTPMPLVTTIVKDIPGIEKFSRLSSHSGTLRYGDKVFNERFH